VSDPPDFDRDAILVAFLICALSGAIVGALLASLAWWLAG
jgi:hypothetical protein